MLFESLLNTKVNVRRKPATPGKDRSGGQQDAFADVTGLTDVPATIQPRSATAPPVQGQRQVVITHAVYLKSVAGVQRGDVIYEPSTQRSFLVQFFGDMAGRSFAARLDVTQIT